MNAGCIGAPKDGMLFGTFVVDRFAWIFCCASNGFYCNVEVNLSGFGGVVVKWEGKFLKVLRDFEWFWKIFKKFEWCSGKFVGKFLKVLGFKRVWMV